MCPRTALGAPLQQILIRRRGMLTPPCRKRSTGSAPAASCRTVPQPNPTAPFQLGMWWVLPGMKPIAQDHWLTPGRAGHAMSPNHWCQDPRPRILDLGAVESFRRPHLRCRRRWSRNLQIQGFEPGTIHAGVMCSNLLTDWNLWRAPTAV